MKIDNYKYYETDLGKLYCGDMFDILPLIEEEIDFSITSPPYDDLRNYISYHKKEIINYSLLSKLLYEKHKSGGIVVWIVNDKTIDGSESLSSFKQAIIFVEEGGWKLHDTMIWLKDGNHPSSNRYAQAFEYMFVFNKGKVEYFNPMQKKNVNANIRKIAFTRDPSGELKQGREFIIEPIGDFVNYFYVSPGGGKSYEFDDDVKVHPAIFPLDLVHFHLFTWTKEREMVLDPMMGSGTTAVACENNNRRWIGIEVEKEYCEIIKDRLEKCTRQLKLL